MKIQLITLYAGPAGVMPAGSLQDVDPLLASVLVHGGYARMLEPARPVKMPPPPAPVVETAALKVAPVPEKAIKPRPRRKSS